MSSIPHTDPLQNFVTPRRHRSAHKPLISTCLVRARAPSEQRIHNKAVFTTTLTPPQRRTQHEEHHGRRHHARVDVHPPLPAL